MRCPCAVCGLFALSTTPSIYNRCTNLRPAYFGTSTTFLGHGWGDRAGRFVHRRGDLFTVIVLAWCACGHAPAAQSAQTINLR